MRCVKFLLCFSVLSVCGCGSASVEVVDLNKVLDVFQATLTELDGKDAGAAKVEAPVDEAPVDEVADGAAIDESPAADQVVGIEVVEEEDEAKKQEFLTAFRTNLNTAKLVASPLGVKMHESGTINGFSDKDNDNVQDAGELELFKVEIDEPGERLVASDGAGHYRDHSYRPGSFFTGYLLGSMLSRNRNYYSGTRSNLKPNYAKTSMSPKTYHSSAVTKAKTAARASSARARTGSRGMSFGK